MSIEIRPRVSILKMLRHLDYKVWYALAEYVDNSIQSFQTNLPKLKELNGKSYRPEIKIEFNHTDNIITVTDNAAGIDFNDFPRAFRPAEIPPDSSGLSEFGMGMKSASFWFSPDWSVRTSTIAEDIEREVVFNLKKIEEENIETVTPIEREINKNSHFTIIELRNCDKMPHTQTVFKIKEHLRSIYREFLRKDLIDIYIDSETDKLEYKEIKILKQPIWTSNHKPLDDNIITWRRDFDFPLDKGKSVRGFVGIRQEGNTKENGLALFRRGRVIEGSFEDAFRPQSIYGQGNSYQSQRLFGEMHFEGFDVSFTKSGINWGENMDIFLEMLKDDLSRPEMNFIAQCENYRVREFEKLKKAGSNTLKKLEKEDYGSKIQDVVNNIESSKLTEKINFDLESSNEIKSVAFPIEYNEQNWKIHIEMSDDKVPKKLYEIGSHIVPKNADKDLNNIGIRLYVNHNFVVNYADDRKSLDTVFRLIAAIGLSEFIIRENSILYEDSEIKDVISALRNNLNEIIIDL